MLLLYSCLLTGLYYIFHVYFDAPFRLVIQLLFYLYIYKKKNDSAIQWVESNLL